jgi:hypothetical protein
MDCMADHVTTTTFSSMFGHTGNHPCRPLVGSPTSLSAQLPAVCLHYRCGGTVLPARVQQS